MVQWFRTFNCCSQGSDPGLGTKILHHSMTKKKKKNRTLAVLTLCQGVVYFVFFCFVLFCFLGPNLRYMEVPRLGVESELSPPAYSTATATQDP